jgi:hypothetical protein
VVLSIDGGIKSAGQKIYQAAAQLSENSAPSLKAPASSNPSSNSFGSCKLELYSVDGFRQAKFDEIVTSL